MNTTIANVLRTDSRGVWYALRDGSYLGNIRGEFSRLVPPGTVVERDEFGWRVVSIPDTVVAKCTRRRGIFTRTAERCIWEDLFADIPAGRRGFLAVGDYLGSIAQEAADLAKLPAREFGRRAGYRSPFDRVADETFVFYDENTATRFRVKVEAEGGIAELRPPRYPSPPGAEWRVDVLWG